MLKWVVPVTPRRSEPAWVALAVSLCRADGDSLRGDRADLCSPRDSHCRVGSGMFALALPSTHFHQQPKSSSWPPSFNPEEMGI